MACGSGCCGPPKSPPPPTQNDSNTESSCNAERCETEGAVGDSNDDESDVENSEAKDDCCKLSQDISTTAKEDPCCGTAVSILAKDSCCSSESKEMDTCCKTVTKIAPAKDACCSPQIGSVQEKDDCCAPKSSKTGSKKTYYQTKEKERGIRRKDGCCGNDEESASDDDCCPPKTSIPSCQSGCCSSPQSIQASQEDVPSCCEGKPSPCCDTFCIDRLALRECESGKPIPFSTTTLAKECTRGKGGKPCKDHNRTAREYYQAKLDALGCICRALLALGQESCCEGKKPRSGERRRSVKKQEQTSASAGSCCGTGAGAGTCASSAGPRPRSKKGCHSPSLQAKEDKCESGCCTKPPDLNNEDASDCLDSCCGNSTASVVEDDCADACCSEKKSNAIVEKIEEVPADGAHGLDLEKGGSGKEHVILSISGMTCTGCETKLNRTLGTLQAVKNLKTSLVLARAEFDVDTSRTSADEVIKHLHRTTEFKCERVTNQGSSLDLICQSDPSSLVHGSWPDGVIEVRLMGKNTIRVDFDAKVVGARDLMETSWKQPLQLAPPRADPSLDAGGKHVRHVGYMTLVSIILTIPVLVLAWAPLPKMEIAYGSASLALATIIQVVIAGPFYPKALKALIFSKVIEMDLLIVLSTSAAYVFSVVSFGYLVAGKPLSTGEFFETSTLLVTLIMVGRWLAALARQKAVESISIRSLQAPTAILVDQAGGDQELDARLLQYGDIFRVLPDCRIPTDGTVISGSSEINESMITGESKPVEKYTGSGIIAGSINGSGTLLVRLNRLPGDNTISTIAGMVDQAKLSKPKIQDIADRVASYFVPVVITLTIITFVIWVAVGIAVRKQSGTDSVVEAITYAITVLIVSCPCAIGLAVPMVIVIASGMAADRGVIFKEAGSIEVACRATDVVFDKTGTLTIGKLSVVHEVYAAGLDPETTKAMVLGLVRSNKHPVSSAVAEHLNSNGVLASTVFDPKILTGKGVEGGYTHGVLGRAGNSSWLGFSSHPDVEGILSKGLTAFCFTIDNNLAAVYGLEDTLRPEAQSTINILQTAGISTHILSGDDDGAVRAVASQLNISNTNVRSRCSPGDKQAYIEHLTSTTPSANLKGKPRKPVVIFIGDGTNDAVALAQATIGIHLSSTSGTDVAQSAADIILLRPDLSGILTAIAVSKKSMRRVMFNFSWSAVYNLFAILLAGGAFVNARIPPAYAGLGELVSVLPVIAAAVVMRWSKV